MPLSVCIIAKNEEQNIARCLESLKPYDFEIVVADTGSTDRTKEMALRYTDKVYDFMWCDDFAAAKNFAVSKASHTHVLVLDSDEFLERFDVQQMERLLEQHPDEVGRIERWNTFERKGERQENREWINRIFAKDRFRYEGRIHEQIVSLDGAEYVTYQTPVVIQHTGYDLNEEERKQKAERNIQLLLLELARLDKADCEKTGEQAARAASMEPETEDGRAAEQLPYILYQLGKSYYMAEDYATACDYFSRGLSYDLNPRLEYVVDMVETYGYALINSGQAETALFFENIYDEFGDSADFQFLMGLIYMNNARFDAAITEFERATEHSECRSQGVNSYRAYYNIGVIHECLGNLPEAERYYEKCGDYALARARLDLKKTSI